MDTNVEAALKGSIRKWEKIADGTGTDEGANNCPLCRKFGFGDGKQPCQGCPVVKHTGQLGCEGTPYDDWYNSGQQDLNAAKRMATFLKSLLPDPLQEANEKWFNIAYQGLPGGAGICALCRYYTNSRFGFDGGCQRDGARCPIYRVTNRNLCWGTPYALFIEAASKYDRMIAARAMYLFLQILLRMEEEGAN